MVLKKENRIACHCGGAYYTYGRNNIYKHIHSWCHKMFKASITCAQGMKHNGGPICLID
jgi:hypothetical protein